MKVGLAQIDIQWRDTAANAAKAREIAAEAFAAGVEFLIFPEMFLTGFSFPKADEARQAQALGEQLLLELSSEHQMHVCGGLPLCADRDQSPQNGSLVFSPDGRRVEYAKLHLFSFSGEQKHYTAGDKLVTCSLGEWPVSLFVCYDLRFPMAFYQASESAEMFVVIANWPTERQMHWEQLLIARAIENQAYVLGVNRVGSGGGINYSGASMIVSPRGEVLQKAGEAEELLVADLKRQEVLEYRKSFPCFSDRKPILS